MSTITLNQNPGAPADEGSSLNDSSKSGVKPAKLVSMIQENPLLLAQIVTENNPDAVGSNMVSLGLLGSEITHNPELLDRLLEIAPRLSRTDLQSVLDVNFDYDESQGPEATNAGMYEAFRIAAAQQGLTDDEATWSSAFPEATAAIGEAQADFHGESYEPSNSKSSGKCHYCKIRTMRRITYGLMGIALLLFIALLIKKL